MKKHLLSVFCLGLLVALPACEKKDKTEKKAKKEMKKKAKKAKKSKKKSDSMKKYINVDDIIIYDVEDDGYESDNDAPMKF